jgi:hypothetical protein
MSVRRVRVIGEISFAMPRGFAFSASVARGLYAHRFVAAHPLRKRKNIVSATKRL